MIDKDLERYIREQEAIERAPPHIQQMIGVTNNTKAIVKELQVIRFWLMVIAVIAFCAFARWWPEWWHTPWWPK